MIPPLAIIQYNKKQYTVIQYNCMFGTIVGIKVAEEDVKISYASTSKKNVKVAGSKKTNLSSLCPH